MERSRENSNQEEGSENSLASLNDYLQAMQRENDVIIKKLQENQPSLQNILPNLREKLLQSREVLRKELLRSAFDVPMAIAGVLADKGQIRTLISQINVKLKAFSNKTTSAMHLFQQAFDKLSRIASEIYCLPTEPNGNWADAKDTSYNRQLIYLFFRFLQYLDQEYFI